MKGLIIGIGFLIFSTHTFATACIEKVFNHNHLRLSLCQNHSNYNETTTLLFQARAKNLNTLVNDLIINGKLSDKKVEIEIYDNVLSYNHLMVSQSPKGYFISCSGYMNFTYLAKVINYFTQKDWESFVYDPGKVSDIGYARKVIETKIDKYTFPNISRYITVVDTLWTDVSVSLVYNQDKILYVLNNSALRYKTNANLPIKLQNRYLFFQQDSIFVIENNVEINRMKLRKIETGDYRVDTYNKWVNVGGFEKLVYYTYSFDKNKFYILKK